MFECRQLAISQRDYAFRAVALGETMNTTGSVTSGLGTGSRKLTALADAAFEDIKERIHNKLVDKLDLNRIGEIEGESLRR